MVASLLKIISTGMQDERLQPPKGQPSIDSLVTVIVKAGRFGTAWARIDFDTKPDFGKIALARLPVQGEIIARVFLVVQMPDIKTPQTLAQTTKINGQTPTFVGPHFGWTNSLGHNLVNQAQLHIGGVLSDTIPGQLMEILDEFQTPLEKTVESSRQLLRKDNGFTDTSFGNTTTSEQVVVNLPFWFSRGDPGCFLPIDALNIDEVRITLNFNPITNLFYTQSRQVDVNGKLIQTNAAGGSLWPMLNSKFYYSDISGSAIPGLEPVRAPGQTVSAYPSSVNMPSQLSMTDAYLLVEYIYLDKAEANRFRIADIQVPVVQHYTFDPVDTQNTPYTRIPLVIPNPTRDIFFYCQKYEGPGYNAPFLATRDLSNSITPFAPWWPDATGLDERFYGTLRPGFSTRFSEPLRWLSLEYSETLTRYSTENVSLFRSFFPSIEQRKAPWLNRYFYNIPFGLQNGLTPFSMPMGEANLDKILRLQISLGFHGKTGSITDNVVDRYNVFCYAETYNILRIYGGRAGMMFAY
uniref:Major capsid protein N-terminal domain-containing protein n=1 Tax=viral metagenome TaxID=1070528 RepID=A0A6C0AN51_9ZZZZ